MNSVHLELCASKEWRDLLRDVIIPWALDDADGSLHLFVAIWDGDTKYPPSITLPDAREQGFNRVLGVFEQSRDGWLTENIEESRPLWALARRVRTAPLPTALRVHVLTDRPISARLRSCGSGRPASP